jgi:hypothetical protein
MKNIKVVRKVDTQKRDSNSSRERLSEPKSYAPSRLGVSIPVPDRERQVPVVILPFRRTRRP